jgi:hypothetical protein
LDVRARHFKEQLMPTLKDILCLLAVLVAYGIVGRMDYDDAVMLEEAERAPVDRNAADCESEPLRSMPASDARISRTASNLPRESAPCWAEPDTVAVE